MHLNQSYQKSTIFDDGCACVLNESVNEYI